MRRVSAAPQFDIPKELRDFFSRLPAVVYKCGPPPSFATIFVSCNIHEQFGYSPEEFYADPLFWTNHIHENERHSIVSRLASIGEANALSYEYRFLRRDGAYVWLHDEVSVLHDKASRNIGLIGSWFDITEYKRLEAMRAGQTQILDFLVKRRSLEESFVQIVQMLESQSDDMVCSILRFDPMTQSLRHGAAPSLPDEYNRLIDGVKIGPAVGSCGTAAYRRERVVVTDIETDPLWRKSCRSRH
ncbi:MAG: PAS domain-containing protein [Planctomycetes bacterium]|nr:PAS domain-containing protein [Planctomycetota bacterium]